MGIINRIKDAFGSASVKTVRVEFINCKDDSTIGIADMPPERLPDTFAVHTTFDIKGEQWFVKKAEPLTKEQFMVSGRLQIFLSPITTMSTENLLYIIPTISDDIGLGEGDAPPDETVFLIHEDDWRQIEFVSQSFAAQISEEFSDIRKIYEDRAPGGGFVKVHVRKRIPAPLEDSRISLPTIEQLFLPKRKFRAVGVQRSLGRFKNSFAMEIGEDHVLWGTFDDKNVLTTLNFSPSAGSCDYKHVARVLGDFCAHHHLSLVNWCKALQSSSSEEIEKSLMHEAQE